MRIYDYLMVASYNNVKLDNSQKMFIPENVQCVKSE